MTTQLCEYPFCEDASEGELADQFHITHISLCRTHAEALIADNPGPAAAMLALHYLRNLHEVQCLDVNGNLITVTEDDEGLRVQMRMPDGPDVIPVLDKRLMHVFAWDEHVLGLVDEEGERWVSHLAGLLV